MLYRALFRAGPLVYCLWVILATWWPSWSAQFAAHQHMTLPHVANYSAGKVWWRFSFHYKLMPDTCVTPPSVSIITEHTRISRLWMRSTASDVICRFSCVVCGLCCPWVALCWLHSLATASGWSVSILLTHSGPGVTARCLWLHPSSCSFILLWNWVGEERRQMILW